MSATPNVFLNNRFVRSVLRHGFTATNRNRALAVFSNFFLHIHPVKVRVRAMAFTRTFYLGGLSAACLFILTVTGVFLMFYYHPSVPASYNDMKDLQFVVSAGTFLRNLHRWSAHCMVLLVFLHMVRVFFAGAYRTPREFNWVLGVGLLVLTLLLSFTGYLLPWDQLAYWAITVGTNMANSVPVIGPKIRFLLLGGNDVGEPALLRFYVLHCVVLPLSTFLLLAVHIWRVRKDGGLYLPPLEPSRDTAQSGTVINDNSRGSASTATAPVPSEYVAVVSDDARKTPMRVAVVQGEARPAVVYQDEPVVMTVPHLLLRELIAWLAISLGLVGMALLVDAPLEELANPQKTPNPAKAPWYFLGLQELLHYYPPVVAGVLLPGLVVFSLAIVPYFGINLKRAPLWDDRDSSIRRSRTGLGIVGASALLTAVFFMTGAHPVWPVIAPLWLVSFGTLVPVIPGLAGTGLARRLASLSLAFWIFLWFLLSATVLTVIGTFFRGPGWSLVMPWNMSGGH